MVTIRMLQLRIDFCAAENSMCDHKIEIYLHQMAILSTVISLFNFCKAFTCKVCFYLYQRATKANWSKYQNHKSELVCKFNIENSEIFDTQTWMSDECVNAIYNNAQPTQDKERRELFDDTLSLPRRNCNTKKTASCKITGILIDACNFIVNPNNEVLKLSVCMSYTS